jgi:hypothetical protein
MKKQTGKTRSVRISERAWRTLKLRSIKDGKSVLRLISELVGVV